MTLQVVRTEDVALMATLRRASAEENAGGPIDDDTFEARFTAWLATAAGPRIVWVALLDAEPVGMLNVSEFTRMPRPGDDTGRWGYVGNAFVRAAHRDKGIGRRLLDAAIDEARARGYVRLVLSPSERSIPFYRRAGFRDADELLVLPLA